MTVRLSVEVLVVAAGVVCRACGETATLKTGDENHTVRAWAQAHRDPRLTQIFSSINGGPVEGHRLSRPRLIR